MTFWGPIRRHYWFHGAKMAGLTEIYSITSNVPPVDIEKNRSESRFLFRGIEICSENHQKKYQLSSFILSGGKTLDSLISIGNFYCFRFWIALS